MFSKFVSIIIGIVFLGITVSFAEDLTPAQGLPGQGLEWSDYGLNFEWAKDKNLLTELGLTATQQEELEKLEAAAAQEEPTDKDIADKTAQLKKQIELKSLVTINGQSVQPNQDDISSLIGQLTKLRGEKYARQMSLKAKLRMLLSDKQRDKLYAHFQNKETELRDKFREQMKGQTGEQRVEMGGHRDMGGMGGMGHGGFGGPGGF